MQSVAVKYTLLKQAQEDTSLQVKGMLLNFSLDEWGPGLKLLKLLSLSGYMSFYMSL